MIGFISVVRETISFFTVVKKLRPHGTVEQRLVWDLRRSNLRWKRPGRAALGSAIAFSLLELETPEEGTQYRAFSGDVPEYYYTCEVEEEMVE